MPPRSTLRLAPDAAGIAEAGRLLRAGRLVAFPTETVYGLGADATDGRAVAAIYEAKGRPSFNPLIAHVATPEAAFRLGRFDAAAIALARAFWPGPLTLVVPVAPGGDISDLARAGLDTVGLRVPDHPVAQALLAAAGRPVAAPSANRSGHVSPTAAAHVLADLDGRIDAVVDGGPTDVGVESTIVACLGDDPVLLRPGGVPRDAVEAVIGRPLGAATGEATIAPGMLASHYAPNAAMRLDATDPGPDEALLAFGPEVPGGAATVLNLSPSGDLAEAAAHLFGHLRLLDASGARRIAVMPIPTEGLGEAIRDRLARAAAPRGE
ncbi:L-threonylcarbamoyladenylate synthase [Phreatobacter cathodiphilus]|uniref:Threonylcarbamoyl-AMP synthase n=1 Tax=Phreatobacter cathodiphilus TaxID=1868589 RepID=A0A2S0N6R5_9HYPH|nr:L-threonylcarbamoyladenylate synthase [Phreatobacter cathodiphilus]AVO43854.1 threonylcarbamoyl-AMP synthase [Phreatobacter cathodiphilus]